MTERRSAVREGVKTIWTRIILLPVIVCAGAGCVSTNVLTLNDRHGEYLAAIDADVLPASAQRIGYPCVVKVNAPDHLPGREKRMVQNPFLSTLYQYPAKTVLERSFERALYRVFQPPGGNVMDAFIVEVRPSQSQLMLEPGRASYDLACDVNLRAPNDRIIISESFQRHETSMFDSRSTPQAVWEAACKIAADYANSLMRDRALHQTVANLVGAGSVPGVATASPGPGPQPFTTSTAQQLTAIEAELAAGSVAGARWMHPGKTRVLCIGISEYGDKGITPVRYAKNDALAFYRFVRESGVPQDHVYMLTDREATRSRIMSYLSKLKQMTTDPDETAVIYFSGHGAPLVMNGQVMDGVLVPYDASSDAMELTAVKLSNLRDILQDAMGRWVVVLDACFSGKQGRSVFASRVKGLAVVPKTFRVGAERGDQWWLTATSGDLFANDFPKAEHGLFTHYLLRALREQDASDANGDGVVTLREAFDWAQSRVEAVSRKSLGQLQKPEVTGSGDLPLVSK